MGISNIDVIFRRAKDVIITWFSVLTRGRDAFSQINLETSSTLYYSVRFALYMAFVSFLLHIPTVAEFNLKNVALIQPVWIAGTYITYLAPCFILYGSMKLFGGEGSLNSCVAVYCLLTAYMPIIDLLMLPSQMIIVPAMPKHPTYPDITHVLSVQLQYLPAWERFGVLLSFLFSTVGFVVFFVAVFRAFRTLHKLNKAHALSAFIIGMLGSVIFLIFFMEAWISKIPKAG